MSASDTQFDPSVASIQSAASAASATALQSSLANSAAGGSSSGAFNGTIGDLQKKYPEIYDKLIVQSIGYQICQQCQDDNDNFIAEIKKHEDGN